jgi:hypothetical protein
MQIAQRRQPHVSPALLRRLRGAVARAASLPRLPTDTLRMWRMARTSPWTFHSARRIADEHHRLATGVNWTEPRRSGRPAAPPRAPTASCDHEHGVLCDEGTAQPASRRARHRSRKRLFVYRVLAHGPLSISKRAGVADRPTRRDNVAAPRATRAAVQAWLRDAEAAASPATPPRPR